MIRSRLQETWYGDRRPGLMLKSLESIYRRSLEKRRRKGLADLAQDLEHQPIIVVGNITAGGTGKTPLVIRLCELLQQAGLNPGVISRGFGRRTKGRHVAGPDSTAAQVGDEPLMIARRCNVPVVVDADRESAARELFRLGANIALSDDGLQRWRLPRDIEFCVIDAERGFGNARLLPAGPLREPLARLETVDYVVSNGDPSSLITGREAVTMSLRPKAFMAIGSEAQLEPGAMPERLAGREVHAVAGIGRPERFFDSLAKLGIKPDHQHSFPDHHIFSSGDFKGMEGVLLMTEKDAVKCAGLGLDDAWYLRVDAVLPSAWEQEFTARVLKLGRDKAA